MKTKRIIQAFLLLTLAVLSSTAVKADEKAAQKNPAATQKTADKPLKGIGVILINAKDATNVILLTKVQSPKNPQGQLVGIPVNLDETGKKIVEEFGIIGMSEGEKNGMERIQKESAEKVVYVDGMLEFNGGNGKLTITDYSSLDDFKKKNAAMQKASMEKPAPQK